MAPSLKRKYQFDGDDDDYFPGSTGRGSKSTTRPQRPTIRRNGISSRCASIDFDRLSHHEFRKDNNSMGIFQLSLVPFLRRYEASRICCNRRSRRDDLLIEGFFGYSSQFRGRHCPVQMQKCPNISCSHSTRLNKIEVGSFETEALRYEISRSCNFTWLNTAPEFSVHQTLEL